MPVLLREFLDTGYRACQSIQTRPKVRVIQGLLSSVARFAEYLEVLRIVDVDQCASRKQNLVRSQVSSRLRDDVIDVECRLESRCSTKHASALCPQQCRIA